MRILICVVLIFFCGCGNRKVVKDMSLDLKAYDNNLVQLHNDVENLKTRMDNLERTLK